MRILSTNGFIEITRGSFDEPADLDIRVESRGFCASAHNIFPLDVGRFFAAARAAQATRRGRLTLNGTESFQLVLEDRDARGGFWAEVQLALWSNGQQTHLLRCKLPVEAEYWLSVLRDLRAELFEPPAPG